MVPANISGYGILGPTGNRLSMAVSPAEVQRLTQSEPAGRMESALPERSGVRVEISAAAREAGATNGAAGNGGNAAPGVAPQTSLAVQRAQALYAANAGAPATSSETARVGSRTLA
ncbi:MAG: hypothetical protein N2557_01415 [Hydrogenophilus sp.]|nr:hypothetical protein [Hydrogenophilus sp.]